VHQLSGLSSQRGASVTSVVFIIIVLGVAAKLIVAIVPAQIGDYQLTKTLSAQLKESNANKETAKQFVERVNKQLSINADYDTKAEEVFTFTDKKTGQLAIHKQYEVTNKLFGNIDIVNRFEGDIDAITAE
jgi:U3 small nucleolar RNA-associated protein 14